MNADAGGTTCAAYSSPLSNPKYKPAVLMVNFRAAVDFSANGLTLNQELRDQEMRNMVAILGNFQFLLYFGPRPPINQNPSSS